ncbi:MAG TPA: FGGY family carbohydrate kinase [Puia sp.]|nr:FGGY family carbohydrate kinase [Puia sp.]
MTNAYIIIDIGTGNARIAVATGDGRILSIEREDIRYEKDDLYPDALYFDTEILWEQVLRMTDRALARVPEVRIAAFTGTSQREGIVLLGAAGESLIGLPNIDHRGREWEGRLKDAARVYQLTGRYPGSLFSAFKLLGIRERRPEIWRSVSGFLSISDWVQYRLSGVARYEHSQASETLFYDIQNEGWSDELCGMFDIDRAVLRPLQSSATVLGPVVAEYARRWPAAAGASVVVGGADTQLAIESVRPAADDVVIVSGTTTPVVRLMDGYVVDGRQRTWTGRHTSDDRFVLEANAGVTGLNYQRLKAIFYPNEPYERIESELAAVSCSDVVASLGSVLADEQTPVTRGGFLFSVPVSHELTRASFVWATLWDIACSIRENYRTLCEVAVHDRDYVWACGGGMQSRTLRRLIAGLLGKKVLLRRDYRQSSVIGGVYCCNRALRVKQQPSRACDVVEPVDETYFADLYREWKGMRNALKKLV